MNTHPRRVARRHSTRAIAAITALATLTLAACGDDDDDDATEATAAAVATTDAPATTAAPAGSAAPADIAPEHAEYCTLAAELDSQDDFPSDEQLEALKEAAPEEIAGPVGQAADALIEAEDPMLVFGDPEIGAAFEEIDAFEGENCGLPTDDEDEGEAQDPSVTVIDPAATRVDISATDFAFAGTEPTEPGRYSFVMKNDGETLHMMILAKLAEGATLDQALESEGEEGLEVEFASTEALPDAEAVVTADLTPGNWVLLCPIPTPEGTPHFAEGMIWEFTVEA